MKKDIWRCWRKTASVPLIFFEIHAEIDDLHAVCPQTVPLLVNASERESAAEKSGGVYYFKTWRADAVRVAVQGVSDRPRGPGMADQPGDLPVGRDLPGRNLPHGRIDFSFKTDFHAAPL